MTKAEQIQKKIDALNAEIAPLREALNEELAKSYVKCRSCKKRSQIKSVTYLDFYWYVEPHGCTGGDYYKHGGEGFRCPKCDATNKFHLDEKYCYKRHEYVAIESEKNTKLKKIMRLKSLFKGREEIKD